MFGFVKRTVGILPVDDFSKSEKKRKKKNADSTVGYKVSKKKSTPTEQFYWITPSPLGRQ